MVTYLTELRSATESFIIGFRDLLANPGGPLQFLQGSVLLVRRSYFNQMPTADPFEYLIRADGELDGTVGVRDPEKATISYSVVAAPQHGTVAVTNDGQYAYTPGLGYTGQDGFTVEVADPGFNALRPFMARVESVPVAVVSAPVNNDYTIGPITNGTVKPVKIDSISFTQAGFRPETLPPVNTVIQPGDTLRIKLTKGVGNGEEFMREGKSAIVRLRDNQLPAPELWTVEFARWGRRYGFWGYTGSCPSGHCDVTNRHRSTHTAYLAFNIVENLTLLTDARP